MHRIGSVVLSRSLLIFIVIGLFLCTSMGQVLATEYPEAVQGEIDLRGYDFSERGPIKLNGEWEFYYQELLEPGDLEALPDKDKKTYINIPTNSATPSSSEGRIGPQSYATLRLTILMDEANENYGLKIKYFSSSYKLWINGKEAVEVGKPAKSKEDFRPQYLPVETFFSTDSEIVELVIQEANFHHRRTKLHPIILGYGDQIDAGASWRIIDNSIIFGALAFFSLFMAVLYFIYGKERVILSLTAITATIALRAGLVDEKVLVRLFPDMSGELVSKLGYLPTFILFPLLVIYVSHLFGGRIYQIASKISQVMIIVLVTLVLITPFALYDLVFQYLQWFYFLCGFVFIIMMIKDGFYKQLKVSAPMVLGATIMLLAAINDYLRELNIIATTDLVSLSILIFILIQAIFIAWRFNDSYLQVQDLSSENYIISQELLRLNEQLEAEVEARTAELTEANQKLEKIARVDALTGIANRRAFGEQLAEIIERAIADGEPVSLLLMDLDHFKEYNDNYGHQAGDSCLTRIAQALKGLEIKTGHPVARFGGEEFVMIVYGLNYDETISLAEEVNKTMVDLKIDHEYSSVSNYITISIGIASCQECQLGQSMVDLIGEADRALYHAKNRGRNCLVHFDDIRDPSDN